MPTLELFLGRWYIRHLAAESESASLTSCIGASSGSDLVDEINLEPVRFVFWSKFLAENTPDGVCTIKTVSGLGALHHKRKKQD